MFYSVRTLFGIPNLILLSITLLWWNWQVCGGHATSMASLNIFYCPRHFCGIPDKSLWTVKLWNMCGVPETLSMSLKLLVGPWYVCDVAGASMLSLTNLLCPRKLLKSDMPVLSLPLNLQLTKINSWPHPHPYPREKFCPKKSTKKRILRNFICHLDKHFLKFWAISVGNQQRTETTNPLQIVKV